MPPLLHLHQSSPTMSNEQLDQQHLLLMQLQDQPLNLAQPSHSTVKQPSPTQLSSQPNSSQNSTASSLSSLMLPATTNPGSSNCSTPQGLTNSQMKLPQHIPGQSG